MTSSLQPLSLITWSRPTGCQISTHLLVFPLLRPAYQIYLIFTLKMMPIMHSETFVQLQHRTLLNRNLKLHIMYKSRTSKGVIMYLVRYSTVLLAG
jgi:hypothetical protein